VVALGTDATIREWLRLWSQEIWDSYGIHGSVQLGKDGGWRCHRQHDFCNSLPGPFTRGIAEEEVGPEATEYLARLMNKVEEFINQEETLKVMVNSRQPQEAPLEKKRK